MVETTSQTRWKDLPRGWRDAAVEAAVESGNGETSMSAVVVIACALWDLMNGSGGDVPFFATVEDAGGGMVTLIVDRATEQYPDLGAHVAVRFLAEKPR